MANAYLDLDPYKESNFDLDIPDGKLLNYALENGITEINRKELLKIVDMYKKQG